MAVLSDYTSGTITLANGSTAVTGTGTLFDVAKFREGDTLQIQNLTAVIASVNSNTSLTLTAPWTGTSLTDASYRARYLPDGARVTAQATTLIELLGNGVLSNLAELGVEDGKVPVGNAAGEYELADLVKDPNGSLGKIASSIVSDAAIDMTASDTPVITNLGFTPLDKSGDVASGTLEVNGTTKAFEARMNRVNGGPGQQNSSGIYYATIGDNNLNLNTALLARETVGTLVEGILAVNAGTQAAFFFFGSNGNLTVPGAITAGSKSFRINHPLPEVDKDLVFMSTEAPKAGVEFWGSARLVNGQAKVDIDAASKLTIGTFVSLTQNAVVVGLNNLDGFAQVKAGRIVDGKFVIIASDSSCSDEVTWHVKAERADDFIKRSIFCERETGLLVPEQSKN